MPEVLPGILVIAACFVGYYLAWKSFKTKSISQSLILIIFCGLILRIFVSLDPDLHKWDERYHALVSKNVMANPLKPMLYSDPVLPYDYKDWASNHIWMHKQPLPLWIMAGSMKLFGLNVYALRLPGILLSTLGIFLMFFIARYLFDDRVAILSSFFFSIHGLIIELAGGRTATDHYDSMYLIFIMLSFAFAIKFIHSKKNIYNILGGTALGLAILTKWLPALIVVPIILLIAIQSRKFTIKQIILNISQFLVIAAAVCIPWQVYIAKEFPMESLWEKRYNLLHVTHALEEHEHPFYYYFDRLRISYGELVYIPVIWFFYKMAKRLRNLNRLAIGTWFLLPYLFFTVASTKMPAYTVIASPAVFIMTSLFVVYMFSIRKKFKSLIIVWFLIVVMIALPIRYSFERVKPFENNIQKPEWLQQIGDLKQQINHPKTIVFNTERPIETMFYIDCIAYPSIPAESLQMELKENGYSIIIKN